MSLPSVIPHLLALFAEEGFPVETTTGPRLQAEIMEGMMRGCWKMLALGGTEGFAGVVACQQADSLPLGPHLFIRFLYVLPKYRGAGVARKLLSALARELVEAGLSHWLIVGQSGGSLRRSYRRLGLVPLASSGITTVGRAAKKLGVR